MTKRKKPTVKSIIVNGVEYRIIHTDNLRTNPPYQRPNKTYRNKRIADKFNWQKVLTPVISRYDYEDSGQWTVCDGQNRVNAIKSVFPEGIEILCMITEDPGYSYFVGQNDERQNVNPNDIWWANYHGLEPNQQWLYDITKQHGLTLIRKGETILNTWTCVNAAILQDIAIKLSRKEFTKLLKFITKRFRGECKATTAAFLTGLSLACLKIGVQAVTQNLRTHHTLRSSDILQHSQQYSTGGSSRNIANAVCGSICSTQKLHKFEIAVTKNR